MTRKAVISAGANPNNVLATLSSGTIASKITDTNTPVPNSIKSVPVNSPNINFPCFVLAGIKY